MSKASQPASSISLLMEVSRLFREDFRRRAQHLRLTHSQTAALGFLAGQPGLTQTALAERLEVHPVTVTQMVDRLEKAGWVRRQVHEDDRRALRLYVTDQADPILSEASQIAAAVREDALRGLSAADRRQLEALLIRVKENFAEADGSL